MAESISETLGRRVRKFREERGYGIREFAEHSGISASYISVIERGGGNPTLSVVETLADALQVPVAALLSRPDRATEFSGEAQGRYKRLPQHVHELGRKIAALPDGTRAHIMKAINALLHTAPRDR